MMTRFACPTCRAPLIVRCVVAAGSDALPTRCPNPFCRTDLPARRDKAALFYALVGTAAEIELGEFVEPKS